MKYRALGQSGIMVSELTLGSANFGEVAPVGGTTIDEARELVDVALDVGVNPFDTADNYGCGDGETFLGEALKGRRDGIVLTSKVGQRDGDRPNIRGLLRKHIIVPHK